MRNCLLALLLCCRSMLSFAQQNVPEIKFDSVADFLKLSLDGKVLGVIGRSGRQLGQFSGAHQLAGNLDEGIQECLEFHSQYGLLFLSVFCSPAARLLRQPECEPRLQVPR